MRSLLWLCARQGKLAGNALNNLIASAAGSTAGFGKAIHAYKGAWVATIVIGTLLLVFVIVVYCLRIAQRLRQDGRMGAGGAPLLSRPASCRQWILQGDSCLHFCKVASLVLTA